MTRKDAINNLNMISIAFVEPVTKEQRKLINDTFDMAIKALDQEPKPGHWINHILSIECSCCGNKLFADDENENCKDYDAIDDLGYKFCPICGAKMEEAGE